MGEDYPGAGYVDPDGREFCCPMCQRLCDSTMPALQLGVVPSEALPAAAHAADEGGLVLTASGEAAPFGAQPEAAAGGSCEQQAGEAAEAAARALQDASAAGTSAAAAGAAAVAGALAAPQPPRQPSLLRGALQALGGGMATVLRGISGTGAPPPPAPPEQLEGPDGSERSGAVRVARSAS